MTAPIRIMICSTRKDLAQYREEAAKIIDTLRESYEKRVQIIEVSMEKEVQSGDRESAVEVSRRWVDESTWVVLILGWNLGTLPAADGRDAVPQSITEIEFERAVEQDKRLFVFLAGDPGTPDAYRALPAAEERNDLKDFRPPTKAGLDRVNEFRDRLKTAHCELFTDIADFRTRLEKTLREALDEPYSMSVVLGPLLLSVRPSIQRCIDKVKLLARCKKIHDALHDLRQKVIRPIFETGLPQWDREPESVEARTLIAGKAGFADGLIEHFGDDIGAVKQRWPHLATYLGKLTEMTPLWGGRDGAEAFRRKAERFARTVQRAFTLSDAAMHEASHALDALHVDFLKELGRAREGQALGAHDERTLSKELAELEANKRRLLDVLGFHNRWQAQYDDLLRLSAGAKTAYFAEDLSDAVENFRELLLPLVREDVDRMIVVSRDSPLRETLPRLGELVEELLAELSVERFVRMHKIFEDVFYQVDKCVREEVVASEKRVRHLEEQLEALALQEMRVR